MKNNIFYTERTDKGAIDVYSTAAGVLTSDYNAVVEPPSFLSTASALFVNAAAKDYRRTVGSPAIDAGVNLSSDVVTEIGCYEMP